MFRSHPSHRPLDVIRRALALLLVVTLSGGCSSMQPLRGAPAEAVPRLPDDARVKLLLTSGERVDLTFVRVEGDSLRGVARIPREGASYYDPGESRIVSYALADIQSMDAMQTDKGKTVSLVIGGAVVVAGVFAILLGQALQQGWSLGTASSK